MCYVWSIEQFIVPPPVSLSFPQSPVELLYCMIPTLVIPQYNGVFVKASGQAECKVNIEVQVFLIPADAWLYSPTTEGLYQPELE